MPNELLHLRDALSKHYDNGDGTNTALVFSEPVHYQTPEGAWDDLSNLIKDTPTGWAADQKDLRIAVENGYISFNYKGKSLTMRPSSIMMVDASRPATRFRKLADASYANVSMARTATGAVIRIEEIFPNVDSTLTIDRDRIAKLFTVKSKPNLPDPSSLGWNAAQTYLVIVWETNVPSGAVVKDTITGNALAVGYVGHNRLSVQNAQTGEDILFFEAGHAISNNKVDGPVYYVVAPNVPFGEAIPYSRMIKTTYPFLIDPTITTSAPTQYAYMNEGDGALYPSSSPMFVGNDSWSDPGCSTCKPPTDPSSGGGVIRSFAKFDLTSLSGKTCNSAAFRGVYYYVDQARTLYCYRVPDWGTLDLYDFNTAVTSTLGSHATDSATQYIYDACWDGALWHAAKLKADGTVFQGVTSSDGKTWTVAKATGASQRYSVANGKVFAGGGRYLYEVTNSGATYTQRLDGGSGADVTTVVYANSTYVAFGQAGNTGRVWYSSDAVSWSYSNVGFPTSYRNVRSLVWDGTYWIASNISDLPRRSTSLTSWANVTNPDSPSGLSYVSVAANGSTVFMSALSAGSNRRIWTSTDSGSTWTRKSSTADGNVYTALSYTGNYLWALLGIETLYRSSDSGATWTAAYGRMAYHPLSYYYSPVAYNGTTYLLTVGHGWAVSTDGSTWDDSGVPSLISLDSTLVEPAFGGNLFIRFQSDLEASVSTSSWYSDTQYLSITYSDAGGGATTYSQPAQAGADIKSTYYAEAQSQSKIQTTVSSPAQSGADIRATYQQYAQAQAYSVYTSFVTAQAQAYAVPTAFQSNAFQYKAFQISYISPYAHAQALTYITSYRWVLQANAQADIKTSYTVQAQASVWILNSYQAQANTQAAIQYVQTASAAAGSWVKKTFSRRANVQAYIILVQQQCAQASAWITSTSTASANAGAGVLSSYTADAQAGASVLAVYTMPAMTQSSILRNYQSSAQAKSRIKSTYTASAQAQAQVFYSGLVEHAQAASWTLASYTASAGAKADILTSYQVHSRASVWMRRTETASAQAQASVHTVYTQGAQSLADILQAYRRHAQASVHMLVEGVVAIGQSQAFILKSAGYALVRARIRVPHAFDSLDISDRSLISIGLSDRAISDVSVAETGVLSLNISDRLSISIDISDRLLIEV